MVKLCGDGVFVFIVFIGLWFFFRFYLDFFVLFKGFKLEFIKLGMIFGIKFSVI